MSEEGSLRSVSMLEEREGEGSRERKGTTYVPGECSGKWSELEHMKYIVFIDFNKEKMRSREKRRSNKFYQEMADFIETRNALQCRSHHQKLQEKYVHPPKIVSIFKPHFSRTLYSEAMDSLLTFKRDASSSKSIREESDKGCLSVATQTEIGGLNLEFVTVNPNCILIQSRPYQYCPPMQSPLYYHQLYPNYQEYTIPTLPSGTIVSPTHSENPTFSFTFGGN